MEVINCDDVNDVCGEDMAESCEEFLSESKKYMYKHSRLNNGVCNNNNSNLFLPRNINCESVRNIEF